MNGRKTVDGIFLEYLIGENPDGDDYEVRPVENGLELIPRPREGILRQRVIAARRVSLAPGQGSGSILLSYLDDSPVNEKDLAFVNAAPWEPVRGLPGDHEYTDLIRLGDRYYVARLTWE